MKKWMLVLVSLMTALFLVACGKNSSETSGDNWSKYSLTSLLLLDLIVLLFQWDLLRKMVLMQDLILI